MPGGNPPFVSMDDELVSAQPDGCAFGPAPTKSRQSVSCRRTSPAPVNGCAKEKVPGQRFIYCCANDCGRNPAFLRAGFAPAACRANRFRPLRSGNPASRKIHLFQLRFRNTSPPAVDLPADLLRRKIMRRRTVTRTPTRSPCRFRYRLRLRYRRGRPIAAVRFDAQRGKKHSSAAIHTLLASSKPFRHETLYFDHTRIIVFTQQFTVNDAPCFKNKSFKKLKYLSITR